MQTIAAAWQGDVARERPAGSVALNHDEQDARLASFYTGRWHGLVHRHLEKVKISQDHSADWALAIDFALPDAPEASVPLGSGDERRFLFPLLYLKKGEGRTGFGAREEDGRAVSLPNRAHSNRISALGITHAAVDLQAGLPVDDLFHVVQTIIVEPPYAASVVLRELLEGLDPRIRRQWDDASLTDTLKMLVEHSLVWLPIVGRPGERRRIEVHQDVELLPRPLRRWRFGKLDQKTLFSSLAWGRRRRLRNPRQHLATAEGRFGKLGRRISFSVLGERIALPFAWLPIEFDFPTIYTRRCRSYHFELVCPNGLSPRGIKLATNFRSANRSKNSLAGGTILGTRSAQLYIPGGRSIGDLTVRATVGIGRGAFPSFWLLMGTITAVMLWSLVSANPDWLVHKAKHSENEVAAGILLVVPALLGALVLGFEGSITRLLGGARTLLLTAGLASIGAAAVLVGARPLDFPPRSVWTVCASVATAATIPLATSWLLSLPVVWRSLGRLNSAVRQWIALVALVAVGEGIVLALHFSDLQSFERAVLATLLLAMPALLILLASNRLAVPISTKRYFLSVSVGVAAGICVLLGCVELRTALQNLSPTEIAAGDAPDYNETAERLALILLPASLFVGILLSGFTRVFREKSYEVHVAPATVRALLLGRRTAELNRLCPGEQSQMRANELDDERIGLVQVDNPLFEELAGATEADWSWGVRSTVDLPAYKAGEFANLVGSGSIEGLQAHMEALHRFRPR